MGHKWHLNTDHELASFLETRACRKANGETIIVEGLQKVRPGMQVTTRPFDEPAQA